MTKELISSLVDEGLITTRKHPIHNIWILNYTAKVQYERLWDLYDGVLRSCRGLVIDENCNIIARPFKKFFNFGELNDSEKEELLDSSNFRIYDKYDGSLGIIFKYNDEWIITTKGSFESEQAIYAQNILLPRINTSLLNNDITYLVEIIYKDNKIIVNYGDEEELVFLAAIHTKRCEEYTNYYQFSEIERIGFKVNGFLGLESINDLLRYMKESPSTNKEGYVVIYNDFKRVKLKYDSYVELHKIKSNFSRSYIWESLSNGTYYNILENMPDEFYDDAEEIANCFKHDFNKIKINALETFINLIDLNLETRKEKALKIKEYIYPQLLFSLLDKKNIDKQIWDILKP